MKIAFSGTHSVGKSTLVDELIKKYPTHKQISNPRRIMAEKYSKFGIYEKGDVYSQSFISGMFAYEVQILDKFIADRSIIDSYGYGFFTKTKHEQIYELIDMYKEAIDAYDVIFYIPIEFKMESDGVRTEDEEYRYAVDQKILSLLKEYRPDFVTIHGTVEERLKMIDDEILKRKLDTI